jgi:putative component of toxin-antitoxin plasmid stabilization module
MGDAHDAGGGPRAARAAWLRALAILTELGHRARADIEARLARLPVAPHGDHVACIDEGEPVRVD